MQFLLDNGGSIVAHGERIFYHGGIPYVGNKNYPILNAGNSSIQEMPYMQSVPAIVHDYEDIVFDRYEIADGAVTGVFVAVIDDINAARLAAVNEINDIRDAKMYGGITYMGGIFKTDPVAAGEINAVSTRYAIDGPGWEEADWQTRHGGAWRTVDNQFVAMTLAEFHGLSDAIVNQGTAFARQAHVVKDQLIPVCNTREELNQVVEDYQNYVPS